MVANSNYNNSYEQYYWGLKFIKNNSKHYP